MPQPRLAALAILGLATVTAAGLALQQYRRAEALAIQLANAQNAAQTAEPPARDSRSPTALAPDPEATAESVVMNLDDVAPDDPPADAPESRRQRRGNRPNPAAVMDQLMRDPAFAEAMRLQQNARLDNRYAALFAQLNLPPGQLAQLKDLLNERISVRRDVFTAARAEGLGRGNRDEIRELIDATELEIESDIRAAIGDQAFTALERFEQTDNERRLVSSLADRLSYSGTPLNAVQSEALVTILAEADASSNDNSGGWTGGPGDGRSALVTNEVLVRAQGVLAPDQVDALRQLQAEQLAAQAVRDAMRNEFRANAANRRDASDTPGNPPGGG